MQIYPCTTTSSGFDEDLFVDEIESPAIINDPWQTADNYRPDHNGIDHVDVQIHTDQLK